MYITFEADSPSESIKAARARIAQLQGALQKMPSSDSLDGSVPGGLAVLQGIRGLGFVV